MEKRDIVIIALLIGLVLICVVAALAFFTLTINFNGEVSPQGSTEGSVVFDGIEYTSTQTINFNYGTVDPSDIVDKPLVLKNNGNTVMLFNIAITGGTWLSCDYDSGSIAAYAQIPATLTLTVPSDAPAGPFSYQVVVTFG